MYRGFVFCRLILVFDNTKFTMLLLYARFENSDYGFDEVSSDEDL